MKRMLAGTFMAATFAVGLAAQAPQTPQNPPSSPPSQPPAAPQASASANKNITVTGCLKAGDAAESFMLSDLKWGKQGDKAVGTSGAPAAIASATSLKLTGSPTGTKLSEHVGHTIEVTGTVAEKSASAPAAPADPAASRPSASAAPSLDVKTVKMVSATCTP